MIHVKNEFDIKSAFGKRVTVTAALPYVNGVKHLGNLVGSILPADVFHRFLDLFGVDNIFICGTDEHGTATEIAALEENLSPQAYSDKYHKIQKDLYFRWNFDFSYFGRTSSSSNHKITQDIFLSAHENGYIIKENLVIPYCNVCNRFLADRYIVGTCHVCGYNMARGDQCEKCATLLDPEDLKDPQCAVCGNKEIQFKEEGHLFLNLPLLQRKLEEWIQRQEHWTENTRNLSLGWLKTGLRPRCITRNLSWGVKVPLEMYEHLVFYCWFDAPIGYVSITKNAYEEGKISGWKAYWNDSKIYHFIGKDNIPFHTIIWPAILLSSRDSEERDTNYQLPFYVKGYEYLNWEGQKFSTSKGIGLFSDKALELYPADYWRFYLASILPESKDSNFDWKDFESHINNELIANYGNLFHRITHFIEKNYGGKLPHAHLGEKEKDMQWKLSKAITEIESHLINVNLREALKCALALSSELNRYFQEKKPWEASEEEVRRTLYVSANVLRSITVMLSPYIPETAGKALKLLGAEELSWENIGSFMLKDGHEIKAEILFDKIDINKMKGYVKKDIKESADIINIDDGMLPHKEFQKVELVTGTILYAKDHPNADKLYILEVDLGDEKRQLVAALKQAYKKEELAGIQVVVVKNLEPREVRGVKSEGMLLAAEDGTLLLPDKHVRDGAKIL